MENIELCCRAHNSMRRSWRPAVRARFTCYQLGPGRAHVREEARVSSFWVGGTVFILDGQRGASPVIFGERGDSTLLGTVSLEALGFVLDPIRRELRALPMVLG